MHPEWSREQIMALAPDAQVGAAAQGLAHAAKWQRLGRDERAAWGEHLGSGSAPYLVTVALDGPAFKCSCPSRKRPCKHALGLFLLVAGAGEAAPAAPPPPWVMEWLGERAKRAAEQAPPAASAPEPAQAPTAEAKRGGKRAAQRESRVQEGVEALARWLDDLVRQGLGAAQAQPPSFWDDQAARLVDAQAPGLARRVRELGAAAHSGDAWPSCLLDRLGRLYLLLEAYARLDSLAPEMQAEVRAQIGWTQDQAALRAQPGLQDHWLVVGQRLTEEDRLRVLRTWLWGARTQIGALALDFAPPGRPLECALALSTAFDGELVFWPGPARQRALVKARESARPLDDLPGYPDLAAALAAYGAALAANPWLERFLMPVAGVIPLRHGEEWLILDRQGQALPLAAPEPDGWRLMAISGGAPLTLAGEWDGERLTPLTVWAGRRLLPVAGNGAGQ